MSMDSYVDVTQDTTDTLVIIYRKEKCLEKRTRTKYKYSGLSNSDNCL